MSFLSRSSCASSWFLGQKTLCSFSVSSAGDSAMYERPFSCTWPSVEAGDDLKIRSFCTSGPLAGTPMREAKRSMTCLNVFGSLRASEGMTSSDSAGKTLSHRCRWSAYMERQTKVEPSITAYSRACSSPVTPRHAAVSSQFCRAQSSSRSTSEVTSSVSFFVKSWRRHSLSRYFFSRLHRAHTASAASRCFTATLFSLTTRTEVMPL
mmetsp:Transcript_20991/g.35977  ORF Transcript_20991/g.35977 Transcript_20991/m.35977 type:complete len:208 (-) Transcript_20991:574-1197(-)